MKNTFDYTNISVLTNIVTAKMIEYINDKYDVNMYNGNLKIVGDINHKKYPDTVVHITDDNGQNIHTEINLFLIRKGRNSIDLKNIRYTYP